MCRLMEEMRNEAAAKAAAKTTAEFLAANAKKNAEKARKMLEDNLSVDKVVEYSGLSLDEFEKLKQEMCS